MVLESWNRYNYLLREKVQNYLKKKQVEKYEPLESLKCIWESSESKGFMGFVLSLIIEHDMKNTFWLNGLKLEDVREYFICYRLPLTSLSSCFYILTNGRQEIQWNSTCLWLWGCQWGSKAAPCWQRVLEDGPFCQGHVAWCVCVCCHRCKQAALEGSSPTAEQMLFSCLSVLPGALSCLLWGPCIGKCFWGKH